MKQLEKSLKKTDKDKTTSLNVSGSNDQSTSATADNAEESISKIEIDPNANVEEIMDKILSLGWIENEIKQISVEPSYVIKIENKFTWLYSVTRKAFFRIHNMSEIVAIEKASETTSYCMINNDMYEVDNELIHCIGWN